ncbi:hypothetical protein BaRGS_00019029 [Batillaria attramentaria]|uniref:Sema domain-containing protein n=1 Tax=Batillaria attramentaria TaxID=370345 RepID=A0ABD0KR36_9CAEN
MRVRADLRTKVIRSGLVIHNIEDAQQYLCNLNLESFSNVVGILPIERMPVIEFIGQRVTSLNVTNVHEHTVAFMGTSYGRLKKVVLSSRAREYSEIVVHDGKAILPDMAFDSSKEHIYLMTTTNMVRKCRVSGFASVPSKLQTKLDAALFFSSEVFRIDIDSCFLASCPD